MQTVITQDGIRSAVGIFNFKLAKQLGLPAKYIGNSPSAYRPPAPAVRQIYFQCVSVLQQGCYVVCLVLQAAAVIGAARSKAEFSHTAAVKDGFI